MRIGDVGAVSPAGDLLAFSLAVVIVAALVVNIGLVEDDGDGLLCCPGFTEIMALQKWSGFDPDGDGVLDPYPNFHGQELQHVPVMGSIVARMVFGDESVEHLFADGEYVGRVSSSIPVSRVAGTTSLFESDGLVRCGTFDCFFAEVDL
jgi:hypothetical protein